MPNRLLTSRFAVVHSLFWPFNTNFMYIHSLNHRFA